MLRHDAAELAAGTEPGQVAGMLAGYTAARRPRTTDAVLLVLPRRSLTPRYDWQPPAAHHPGDAD